MPTQIGSIDLMSTNAVKLAAEASFNSALENYYTKSDFTVAPGEIASRISNLTTTLGTNADGTTKANDVVHRASALEQDLSGFKTTASETYATKTEAAIESSGSGESVTAESASKLTGLTVYGKSVQDGTPSPSAPVEIRSVEPTNLLDYDAWKVLAGVNATLVWEGNGVTITANNNDAYTDYATTFPTAARIPVSEGEVIYLLWDSPDIVAGLCYIFGNGSGSSSASANNNGARLVKYTVPSGITFVTFRMGVSAEGNTIRYRNIRIVKGNPRCYVPYGSIGVLAGSRNRFKGISVAQTVNNGVTWSYDADANTFKASGTPTAANTDMGICFEEPLYVPEGESLTFSFHGTAVFSNSYFFAYDNHAGWKYKPISSSTKSATLSDVGGCTFVRFMVRTYQNSGNLNIDAQIQLELGSEATDYEPYRSTTTPIPLQGNALRSLPDGTEDELTVDAEGNVTMVQKVGATTIDGSEGVTWLVGSTANSSLKVFFVNKAKWQTEFGDLIANSTGTTRGNLLCDILPANNAAYNTWTTPSIQNWVDSSAAIMIAPAESVTTSSAFNAWLQSNPLTVLYPLATPQTISLGTVSMPELSDGDTIWVDAEVTPEIDASWLTSNGGTLTDYATVSQLASTVQQTSSYVETRFTGVSTQIADLDDAVSGNVDEIAAINESLDGKMDADVAWAAWIREGTQDGSPVLELGESQSDFAAKLSNTEMGFYEGATQLAVYGGKEGAAMPRASIDELTVSGWKWAATTDAVGSHLSLKFMG